MPVKEGDGRQGTLAGAEIEKELVVWSQKKGADHDRMEMPGQLGKRALEAEISRLMVIEPHPALSGGIITQAAKLLERPQQTFLVEHSVMKANRLKVFPRHRCQDWLLGHGSSPHRCRRCDSCNLVFTLES